MVTYILQFSDNFDKRYRKIIKKDKLIIAKIDKTVDQLRINPHHVGIKSHIVDNDNTLGNIWSSRVTGDIRILWAFSPENKIILILLKIGTHDEVY